MERYRLKNIIILILLLLNVFLSASLLTQKITEHNTQRTAAEQLAALFAADGMQLDPNIVSYDTPPASCTISRDPALENRAAQQILGQIATSADQGGGISVYSSQAGTVQFRSGGSFDAVLETPIADGTRFCTSFCKAFSCSAPQFYLDDSGSGTAVALLQRDRMSIYNSPVTFTLEDDMVTAISGTLIPENSTPLQQEQETLSALAALIAFQQSRQETGSVVSSISGMELCWELQSSSGGPTLFPVWRISTNTADFYVNCVSGTVRRS